MDATTDSRSAAGRAPRTAAVFVVVVALSAAAGAVVPVVSAQGSSVEGTADLEVEAPENRLDPGTEGTLELFVTNDGAVVEDNETHPPEAIDRATEARATSVDITSTGAAPVEVRTGEQSVGTVEDGDTAGPVGFDVYVEEDARAGTYFIDVTVEYTDATNVTYEEDSNGNLRFDERTETRTETQTVEVEILEEARFTVDDIDHSVRVGDDGDLTVTMLNTGDADVTDAVVTASAPDGDITFGAGGGSSEAYVGGWDSGEAVDLGFRVGAAEDATERSYPVELEVEYEDADGEARQRTVLASFAPAERQSFTTSVLEYDLAVDDTGTLTVAVGNEGPADAANATLTLESGDAAIEFNPDGAGAGTSTAPLGDLAAGENATATFRLGATADAIERPYPLEATVEYEEAGRDQTARTGQLEVTPDPKQAFAVDGIDHSVAVGDDGVVELELTNRGPRDARATTVTLESPDGAVQIGSATDEPVDAGGVTIEPDAAGAVSSEAFVGEWDAGETVTVRYVAAATDDAIDKEYPLEVTVAYENTAGDAMAPRSREVGFEPFGEQGFAVEGVESSLRVGEDGDLTGELRNTGEQAVSGVVLQVESAPETLVARESQYAVGELAANESAPVSFRIGATGEAEPGPRAVEFTVRYRNAEGDVRVSDAIDVTADVGERRDRFAVTTDNATLAAGDSGTVAFEVRNRDDRTLRNIRMKIFTNSPLDSGDSEAFIPELEPGETETVAFELSAADGAVARTYPVSVDFRFEDGRNETQMSRTLNAPVEVTDDRGGGLSPLAVGLVALTLVGVGAGVVGWRRRKAAALEAAGTTDDEA